MKLESKYKIREKDSKTMCKHIIFDKPEEKTQRTR